MTVAGIVQNSQAVLADWAVVDSLVLEAAGLAVVEAAGCGDCEQPVRHAAASSAADALIFKVFSLSVKTNFESGG